MVKIVVITMTASLLAMTFSGRVGVKILRQLTLQDLDEHFLLCVFTCTILGLLFIAGLCGFFLWPMCYGIEWVFNLI
ncbi:hypothetical protein D5270_10200 [Acutalibacter sp. 1XD8-36]|nr:hypothetical protein [Acutalibacter sp. 1XD8-36]